jgi:hypothetical protein
MPLDFTAAHGHSGPLGRGPWWLAHGGGPCCLVHGQSAFGARSLHRTRPVCGVAQCSRVRQMLNGDKVFASSILGGSSMSRDNKT